MVVSVMNEMKYYFSCSNFSGKKTFNFFIPTDPRTCWFDLVRESLVRITVNFSYEAHRSEVISIVSNGTQLTNPYDHMGVIVKLDEKFHFCDSAWAGLW